VHPIPVLAAGGIAERRGVAAAMALGAAGVWVGTRFLVAEEAAIHPVYRERVLAADGDATVYGSEFDVGWPDAPHRVLRNSTTQALRAAPDARADARPGAHDTVARRADGSPIPRYHFAAPHAAVSGDAEAMALYAGQGVGLVRAREPAARIVEELARGLGPTG
jgi:nitronate monooxygenase